MEVPLLPGRSQEQVTVTATRVARPHRVGRNGRGDRQPAKFRACRSMAATFYELSLLLPGRGAAGGGLGRIGARRFRHQRQRRARGCQQLLSRWRVQRRSETERHCASARLSMPFANSKSLTSTYDASFGRNGGGQINVVLRSGGNQLPRHRVRVLPQRACSTRATIFAPRGRGRAAVPAQPVRRLAGRADRQEPDILLRRLRRAPRARGHHAGHQRADAGGARGRLLAAAGASPIDPFTQQPFPRLQIPQNRLHPIGAGDRGALSAAEPLHAASRISSPRRRCADRDDHFDVRLDHALGAFVGTCRSATASATAACSSRSRGPGFPLVPGFGDNVPRRAQNAMAERDARLHAAAAQRSPRRLQPRRAGRRSSRISDAASTAASACPRSVDQPARFRPDLDLHHRLLAARRRRQQSAAQHHQHLPVAGQPDLGRAAATW